jgi:choline kinase
MVEYKNTQIIDYIIESLRINNLNDIVLIKGYLSDKLKKNGTKEVINEKYDTTNMVYTLFEAAEHMDGESDLIISYSDIVYSPKIVKKLLEDPNPLSVVIDRDWYTLWSQRMDDPLSDAETLKLNKSGYIIEIGKKPNSYSDIEGQYIGLIKIRSDMVKKILKFYKESNLDDNIYLTDFLTLVSKNICPLKAITINGGWAEFDTLDDLKYVF